jgi:hypothetical protein
MISPHSDGKIYGFPGSPGGCVDSSNLSGDIAALRSFVAISVSTAVAVHFGFAEISQKIQLLAM